MTKKATILQSYGLFPDFRVQRQIELLKSLDLDLHAINWKRQDSDKIFPVSGVQLNTVVIDSKYGLSSLELMKRLPDFWKRSYRILKEIQPDLLVCNNFDTLVPALLYKMRKGGVVVYESREPYHKVVYMKTKNKLAEYFFWVIEMFLVWGVNHTVTVTPNMVAMYKKMRCKPHFFPNAPTPKFIEDSYPELPDPIATIGFVGNIRPGFSIEMIWKIVKDINSEAGEIKLKLLMCGPQLAGMEKVVAAMVEECPECVEVLQPVKVENIPDIYRRIDIAFSLPEENEKFSKYLINVKLFESLAAGVPVVANGIGENKDVLGDNQSALWVENDYQSVRQAVETLVDDPNLRSTMGKTGRQFVKEHFNWGLFEKQYREILVSELEKMESPHG